MRKAVSMAIVLIGLVALTGCVLEQCPYVQAILGAVNG